MKYMTSKHGWPINVKRRRAGFFGACVKSVFDLDGENDNFFQSWSETTKGNLHKNKNEVEQFTVELFHKLFTKIFLEAA